jgi:hypothetical protein
MSKDRPKIIKNKKIILYHLSGLLSNTKSTLCPFSLRMLAAKAAYP